MLGHMKYIAFLSLILLLACDDYEKSRQVTYDSILGVWKYSDPDGKFSTEFEIYQKAPSDYSLKNITFVVDGNKQTVEDADDYVFDDQEEAYIADIKVFSATASLSFYENQSNDSFTEMTCETLVFVNGADEDNFQNVRITR